MPRFGKDGPSIEAIADAALALFQKASETLPCTRLALSAHDFVPAALTEQQGAITRFFAGPAASATGLSASCHLTCSRKCGHSETDNKPVSLGSTSRSCIAAALGNSSSFGGAIWHEGM